MLILLLVTFLLFGCHGPDYNNYGFGYRVDEVGPTGLRLQWNPDPERPQWSGPYDPSLGYMAVMEKWYAEVLACTGLDALPPFVVIVRHRDLPTVPGKTFFDPPLVMVHPNLLALRHEYVHYLLAMTGFPEDDNTNHNSPLFLKCGIEEIFPPQV